MGTQTQLSNNPFIKSPRGKGLLAGQSYQWYPYKIYVYYRILLSSLLLAIYFVNLNHPFIGFLAPVLYYYTSLVFLLISLATVLLLHTKHSTNEFIVGTVFTIDIFLLIILMYANAGISSPFSILLVVTVAASSSLLSNKISLLIAAIATILLLFQQLYISNFHLQVHPEKLLLAGILGGIFFLTTLILQRLSYRIRISENLALQKELEVLDLEQLNHHIIQHFNSGIVVTNQDHKIRLINETAWKMIGMPKQPETKLLAEISPALESQLNNWLQNPSKPLKSFRTSPNSIELTAQIFQVVHETKTHNLILLDDTRRLAEQAQQLKLAALARLTAGIAHEIRNPLGAISHAAQLLSESEQLSPEDLRLSGIIHQHCRRMNTIIENVLQLSRRKQAVAKQFCLEPWLQRFIAEFLKQYDCNSSHLSLHISPKGIQILFDPTQLTQILNNLCENGLRYSEQNTGKKFIALRGGITEDTKLPYLEVQDKGPGIPKGKEIHLFEPFYTTEVTGTGLGLYIARELCEANYARLDYIPTAIQGCCFRIIFKKAPK